MNFYVKTGILVGLVCSLLALSSAKEDGDYGVVRANNQFGFDMYKLLAKNAKGDNLLFSPLSLFVCLGMIHEMSEGQTAAELGGVLHLNGSDRLDVAKGYHQILTRLDAKTTSTANNLFVDKNFSLKQSYKDLVSRYYGAATENLDFQKAAERARQYINSWVASRTNQKITNLFKEGTIGDNTAMVVVSALYFKGEWKTGFKKSLTRMDDFFLADGTKKKVEMMSAEHSDFGYAYLRNLDSATAVAIPYKSNQQMVIIVPREADGLERLEELLSGMDFISEVYNKLNYGFEVRVTMPKFSTKDSFDLRRPLMELGAKRMFDRRAELTRGSDDPQLEVSGVVQGTAIVVDEEGTEAAAASGAVVVPVMASLDIDVNRPFLFAIVDSGTKAVLFFGRLTNPK